MRHDEFDLSRAVMVHGAPFTCRTLHSPDNRFGEGRYANRDGGVDRLFTCTLAAIWTEPTMTVTL